MPTHLGFLRAVNLGARRKFPKDELRAVTEAAGFTEVQTYLNTGNIRVTSRMRSRARIEDVLETAFARDRGFEVPTLVFGQAELTDLVGYAVALGERSGPLQRHYVSLLREEPAAEVIDLVQACSTADVEVVVHGRSVQLMWTRAVPGDVDPLGAAASRALGTSTSRTITVLTELVRRWC